MSRKTSYEYDFVIVGSGFGGSVSAMRLAQKGYRVAIVEQGVDYKNTDFPKTNWNVKKYLWAPVLRCFGIMRITLLNKVMVLRGVGVGGGSLVYANTLMQPEEHIFKSNFWPAGKDWNKELGPFFDLAKKMLGVVDNEIMEDGELALKAVGEKMGCADTFHATKVGVYFNTPGKLQQDPFFGGDGPDREGCDLCGGCMVGCPTGAKNTLDKNYLWFAKKWGAKIFSETCVEKITPEGEGYTITTKNSTSWLPWKGPTFKAKKVIFSAGVLGTMDLLLKNKYVHRTLPQISDKLGHVVRTNGESLLGATSFKEEIDMSKGIAIGAAIHPDEHTKIEAVRYSAGSDSMRLLAIPLTGKGNFITRPIKFLCNMVIQFPNVVKLYLTPDWAKKSLILLVMQSLETKMNLTLGWSIFNPFGKSLKGKLNPGEEPVPSYIPIAQEAAKTLATEVGGIAQNIVPEVLLQTPATAHILGGAILAESAADGVINSNHEVFGYSGLYVMDASVIPSNLAVNPSLTVSAIAERFASLFENNPQVDDKWKKPESKFTV